MRPPYACLGLVFLAGCGAIAPTSTSERARIVQLSTLKDHACALDESGVLRCWGNNTSGEVGVGHLGGRVETPTIVGGDARWKRVSAGLVDTCAIRTDGSLWCWGSGNGFRSLDGTSEDQTSPVRIGAESDWVEISVGNGAVCGIHASGAARCFTAKGARVLEGGPAVREVSVNLVSAVALDAQGSTYLAKFELGDDGQFAYASALPRLHHVHQGAFGVLGIDDEGRVVRWTRERGVERSEQGRAFIAVGGAYGMFAVASDGTIWAQTYRGVVTPDPFLLEQREELGGNWVAVEESFAGSVCGLRSNGTVACAELDAKGTLGPLHELL